MIASSRLRRVACGLFLMLACGPAAPDARTPRPQAARGCSPEVRRIDIGDDVYDVAFGDGRVWLFVGDETDNYFVRSVDAGSASISDAVAVGEPGTSVDGITSAAGSAWIPVFGGPGRSQSSPGVLLRIDASTDRIVARITVGRHPNTATAAAGSIWVANHLDRSISVIDVRTNRVTDVIKLRDKIRGRIISSDGALWLVAGEDGDMLLRIDPQTHDVDVVMTKRAVEDGFRGVGVVRRRCRDRTVRLEDQGGVGRQIHV